MGGRKSALSNTAQIRVARRLDDALVDPATDSPADAADAAVPAPVAHAETARGPTLGGRPERLLNSPTPVVRVTGEFPATWSDRTPPPPADEPVSKAIRVDPKRAADGGITLPRIEMQPVRRGPPLADREDDKRAFAVPAAALAVAVAIGAAISPIRGGQG